MSTNGQHIRPKPKRKQRRSKKKKTIVTIEEDRVPNDPPPENLSKFDVEIHQFVRNSNMPCNVFVPPNQHIWKVLSARQTQADYPADYKTVKLYYRQLKQPPNSTDLLHIIFLNQSYGTPFFGVMDSASDVNVIHPSRVTMILEVPWSGRIVEHDSFS